MRWQKGFTAVAFVIIIVVALVVAGLVYYFYLQVKDEALKDYSRSGQEEVGEEQNQNLSKGTLEVGSTKVIFSYPNSWGDFVKPTVDGSMRVITEGPYKDRGFAVSFLGDSTQDSTQGKVFEEFPFIASKTSRTPYGYLMIYPENLADDQGEDAEWFGLTGEEKEAVIRPLANIYNNQSLSVDISQNTQAGGTKSSIKGGWWGNDDIVTDRLAPKYYKNDNNDLRGVGYFDISYQGDYAFNPSYDVVLINISTRAVVLFSLPLDEVNEIKKIDTEAEIEEGYSYLSDSSNYSSTPLGDILGDIEETVKSMTIN